MALLFQPLSFKVLWQALYGLEIQLASIAEMKQELQLLIDTAAERINEAELVIKNDAVQTAVQTGRLDLASFLMATVAILAIFAGLFAFGYVRGQSYAVAKKVAEDIAEKRLTDLVGEMRNQFEDMKKLRNRTDEPTNKPSVKGAKKASAATEMNSEKEE